MTDISGHGGSGHMNIDGETARWREPKWPPLTCVECGKSFNFGDHVVAHSLDMAWVHRECHDARRLSKEGSAMRDGDDLPPRRKQQLELIKRADALLAELSHETPPAILELADIVRDMADMIANPPCCNGGPQWGHDWNCPTLP